MSDEMISQEEREALLGGGSSAADASNPDGQASGMGTSSSNGDVISDTEHDMLTEMGNISMGSAATTLSVLLGHKVSITSPTVSISPLYTLKERYPVSFLVAETSYSGSVAGNMVLCMQSADAAIIADLMMGNDGTAPDEMLDDIHMSALSEAMSQMAGSVATSLSSMSNSKVDVAPSNVRLVDFESEEIVPHLLSDEDTVVQTIFHMEIDGLIDSEIIQILPVSTAKEIADSLMNPQPGGENEETAIAAAQASAAPGGAGAAASSNYGYGASPMQPHVASNVPVQSAQFAPLNAAPVQVNDANIGLILDVPLQVNVELGRTKKSIKDILDLTKGSIVELDKLAGEPVDILVNGKYLAKGEVVVIDENFGVRITEIVSPLERAARLQ